MYSKCFILANLAKCGAITIFEISKICISTLNGFIPPADFGYSPCTFVAIEVS